MELSKIEEILVSAEEVVLTGEKHPDGKLWTAEGDRAVANVVPKIIEAYELAQSSGAAELLGRIYHLARIIRQEVPHIPGEYTEIRIEDQIVSERLREIAMEGRDLSLTAPDTVKERIEQGKLYFHREGVFAAQIKDPTHGRTASVCSNCDEPLAFIDFKCRTCDHELIDAVGMPTIAEWKELTPDQKQVKLEHGFIDMFSNVRVDGDWRGEKSPINRLKHVAYYSD